MSRRLPRASGIVRPPRLFRKRPTPISPAAMPHAQFFSPQAGRMVSAPPVAEARFAIGEVVRHRLFGFRGVVFDIDPVFANSEEWNQAIPAEAPPRPDPPVYPLFAHKEDAPHAP